MLKHADRFLWSSAPARPVALLRVVLGVAALLRMFTLVPELQRMGDRPAGNSAIMLLFGGGASSSLPYHPVVATVAVAVFGVGALLFTVGMRTRVAGLATAATALYLTQSELAFRANNLYLLGVLILLVSLGNADGAWTQVPQARRPLRVWSWSPNLVRVTISIAYLFAALAKVNEDFLSGATLHESLSRSVFLEGAIGSLPTAPPLWTAVAVAVIAGEAFLVFGLWWSKTRVAAVAVGVLLHVPFILLTDRYTEGIRLVVFATIMLATYLLAIPAEPASTKLRWDPTVAKQAEFVKMVRRQDLFNVVVFEEHTGPLTFTDGTRTWEGGRARRQVYDRLPATFLLSPFIRLLPTR